VKPTERGDGQHYAKQQCADDAVAAAVSPATVH